ncbi:phage GP46 family protein [Enterobacter asburiae]|uniref:Phage GP46 family protein n=1 Tax=Enterobacter asburiae TaxID=61645 RepID=A0A376FEL7_ENTAS|nr:phage GP46 family protein [Enterobacter asburiae]AMA03781.1 phage GP46 family protein [Enterobacter asburiae]QPS66180.1 phage GP46 family protein [Enterobacter asburiae]STD21305.1 phage GP46 family protein [Enterobacter asburiae]
MILYVNGLLKESTDPLDLLTRAVVISLFSWRRAESDDRTQDPYGWWGDTWPTVQNDRIGSRLYLLKRRKLTNKTPQDAREYMQQALAWMTEDGVAARVDVTAERTGIDTLAAGITIYQRDGTIHNITFDDIWSELDG